MASVRASGAMGCFTWLARGVSGPFRRMKSFFWRWAPRFAKLQDKGNEGQIRELEERLSVEKQKRLEAERQNVEIRKRLEQECGGNKARVSHRRVLSLQGVVWQYEDEDGEVWHTMPLPPEGNDEMHELYLRFLHDPDLKETRVATVYSAGVTSEVDFHLMQQTRCDTKMVRKIRMLLGVPAGWTTPAAALLLQGNHIESLFVEVSDKGFLSRVQDILRLTGHARDASKGCSCMQRAQVKSVYRIENWRLWEGYKLRREALRKQHDSCNVVVTPVPLDLDEFDGGSLTYTMTRSQDFFCCSEELACDINEKILLHGTSWHKATLIALNGFDHRTCARCMYGCGTYFAASACKSHQYSAPCNEGKRTLIISRVALGDAYVAKEVIKERRPPVRNAAWGDTYDSIVVEPGPVQGHQQGRQIHQEFVIFNNQQAYPAFVVQYEC